MLPTLQNRENAPAYWFLDILWIVLASSKATGGAFSVMEQLMPEGAGPKPHIHPNNDEWFYILDGAIEMQVGEHTGTFGAGTSIFIPRQTAHAFRVKTTSRVLNGFTPGAMDELVVSLARPAEGRGLPPKGLDTDPAKLKAFADNEIGHPV